jgi:hypothetical protein
LPVCSRRGAQPGESGLVLDIYCLMPYANTEQNWVVFAIERFRTRLSESEKWLNALLFL